MYFEKMFFSRFFYGEKDLFAKFAHAELRPDELLKRVFQIVQPDDGVPIALRQMKLQPQHLFRKRRITVDLFRNRIAEGELLPVRFHLKTELADQMISVTVFRPEEIEIKNSGDGSPFGSCPESYGRRFPRERRKITGNYCNHVSRFSFHTQAPDTAEEARGIREGNPVGELPMTGPESGAVFELFKQCVYFVEEHLAGSFTVREMARKCRVSERKLFQLFHERLNMAPFQYVAMRKVTLARRLLGSGMSGGEIAEQIGFSGQNYFVRFFKRETGMTPEAYRRSLRQNSSFSGS